MPAMKNSAPQTSAISMLWPKSGCSTSSVTVSSSRPSAMVLAGISGRREDSANNQAIRMTNAGFRNSEGWTLTPSTTIHRRAPLTSAPNQKVATTNARLTRNTTNASRRICRGVSNEVAISTMRAGTRNSRCRLTK